MRDLLPEGVWGTVLWVGIVIILAAFLIWVLFFVNRRLFRGLAKKHGGIHYIFFERLNRVLIVVGVLVIAISALDSSAAIWKTLLGGTAVVSAVVAFAAQDVIKDILAGLMISVQKPFEIGDRIELSDGTKGIVEDITNRHVVLRGVDTLRVIIPNSKVNALSVHNFSYHRDNRSVKFRFPIGYGSDVDLAKQVILDAVKDSPLSIPGKTDANGALCYGDVYFMDLEDSALVMVTTVYYEKRTSSEKLIDDVQTRVRAALLANSIEIPYQYVNIVSVDK